MRSKVLLLGAALVLLAAGTAAGAEPSQLLLTRGIAHYQQGRLKRAAELLRRATAAAPHSVNGWHYLGLAQLRLKQAAAGRRALTRALRLDPRNPRLLLDLGLAYLQEGNEAWAVRRLRQAHALAPDDGRIRYHLGVALLRMGAPQAALEQLAMARHEPGLDWRRVRLQLGLAHYEAGQWERCRALVGPLVGLSDTGLLASRVVRASYAAQGVAASWVSARLSVSGVVDSNPLYEHEVTAPTAVGPGVAAALTLRPYVDRRNLLWGRVAGSRVSYYATEDPADTTLDVQDASRSDLRGQAVYERRLGRGTSQLSLGYDFGLILLDGSQPLADANHIFLEQHALHLALQLGPASATWARLRLTGQREDYADLPRGNWGTELSLELGRPLGSRGRLLGWLLLRHEAARSPDYDALVPGVGAGVSLLGPWGLVFGLRLGYEHESHYDSADGRWGKQRLDNTLLGAAEVSRGLPLGLRVRAVYQRLQKLSTVADFDYARDLATLALEWSTP